MTPQDYQIHVRNIAGKFIQSRARPDDPSTQKVLLEKIRNNPSEVQFYGYMVSAFHAYHTPEQCASIVADSPSQQIDPEPWKDLPPREALFAMAFELLKNDVWQEVLALLEAKDESAKDIHGSGQQLTMFGNE